MRSKKEYYGLTYENLTDYEKEHLTDLELNICDKCGTIHESICLIWLESGLNDKKEEKKAIAFMEKGLIAICENCWNE